jgi:hypothetical protein
MENAVLGESGLVAAPAGAASTVTQLHTVECKKHRVLPSMWLFTLPIVAIQVQVNGV